MRDPPQLQVCIYIYIYIYAFLCVYVLIICFVNCNIYNTLSASNLLYCSNPKWCRCFETQLTNRLFSNMTHGKAESWLAERPPSRGYSQPIRKRIPDDVTMTSPGDMLNDLIYYIWAICTLGDIPSGYHIYQLFTYHHSLSYNSTRYCTHLDWDIGLNTNITGVLI